MTFNAFCQQKEADLEKVKEFLDEDAKLIEEEDEHGVSPLQQAAFRGNVQLVRLLLKRGANVNANNHNEGYTTLMFGALSGNCEVVRELLDAGAKTHPVNKVNRTAAEMASFVGLKDVVATIKGHLPRSELTKFSVKQGSETEPRLISDEIDPLRFLIMELNVHPVKVVLRLENTSLISKKVCSVLESLCETYYKKYTNEWLSGKLHFLQCIIEQLLKIGCDETLKLWMKARREDGFKLALDNFIRQCVRSYPFRDSSVFRQMVMTLASTSQEAPITDDGALALFLGGKEAEACNTCWESDAKNRCSACKEVSYCDRRCQKLDWTSHKKLCDALKTAKAAGDQPISA